MAPTTPADDWSARSRALADDLARTGLGDRAAFARLYEASKAHLFGVILRIERDRGRAEDVLQEVFVSVWRSACGFDAARSQPLTWLTAIARNRAIDQRRRRRAETETMASDAGPRHDDDDTPTATERAAAVDADPMDLLQQAGQARQLENCVQALSAPQQQCVALGFYQGLSHAEIASHLAQPLGTVKSWLRRALAALKDCLDTPGGAGRAG